MNDIAQIPRVRAPAFRSLLVREYLDEREVIYRGGVAAHFEPRIEQVVLLVRLVRAFLDLFEFQIVAALFAYLRNGDYAELKATGFGVVLQNLFAEP